MAHAPFRPAVARTPLKDRLSDPFVQFAQGEANSGFLLLAAAVLATGWASLGPSGSYDAFWNTPLTLGLGTSTAQFTLRHAVQDGLMVLFFLLMGLEIRREIAFGELSSVRKATLPIVCALGGMVVPAGLYLLAGGPTKGFGVPMATDIAFALGALAILGNRVPAGLKLFLAAIAIVDDLGAILVIALFYGHGGAAWGFGVAAGMIAILYVMNRMNVRSLVAWSAAGLVLWVAVLASGVHATVAGVLLAVFMPVKLRLDPAEFRDKIGEALDEFDVACPTDLGLINPRRQETIAEIETSARSVQMPLERMENLLAPYVTYGVMPLFALSSAGIDFRGLSGFGGVGIGILVGLLLGKPLGLLGAAFLAVRTGLAELPTGIGWRHVAGVGVLAGIGFTMALFIAELAFGRGPSFLQAQAAITTASVVAGVVGVALLSRSAPRPS